MMQTDSKHLHVWQQADTFAHLVHQQTKGFPENEKSGLAHQLIKTAFAIVTNIAEATGRSYPRERKQFANVALRALTEADYLLNFCFTLGYLNKEAHRQLQELCGCIEKQVWKFYLTL